MDSIISEHSVITATRDQVSGDLLDEDVVILNLKNGVYYGLNPVGGRVWSLIQEPRVVAEMRGILLEEYDVDPERCTRELLALLQELETRGLIEVKDEPPG